MASGGYDSNGIWIYGEDDNPDGTASGLLNLGQASVSTAIGTEKARPPYTWTNSTARAAQTGMALGDTGTQHDTGVTYRYDGSAWKEWSSGWITWTTAPTNFTIGTGGSASSLQRYKWISGRLFFQYKFVLGTSGASVGTNPTLNLPLSIDMRVPTAGWLAPGKGNAYDAAPTPTTIANTETLVQTATTVRISTIASGVYASITSTAPITWAAGDMLAGEFWADPA